jgi:hypothetical protein
MMEHRSNQNYPNTIIAPSSSKRNGKIGAMNRIYGIWQNSIVILVMQY